MPATVRPPLASALRAFATLVCAAILACLWSAPAQAANCNQATSQGPTGPANWQTYCWLDLSSYNHGDASDSNGQLFSYNLPDGTTMTFRLRVTAGPTLTDAAAPSWTGAAVGNTAFIGIGGRPILYQTAGGTSDVTISNIALTPPPGSGAITAYMFVAADAESSNDGESLRFVTNGDPWSLLDRAGPTSGSTYPTISGTGTSTVNIGGVGGTVGAHIVGSVTPTQITTRMVGSGLQGVMFAVRFASIRLDMQIQGARAAAADQFTFDVRATSGGTVLATGSSSGTGLGPFTAASLTTASALPITLTQAMASGSTNTIDHYRTVLTCTNASVSTTPLPSNVVTTSYSFGALQFGDNVQCTFTSTPYPHLQLRKLLGSGGRRFASDQFVLNILERTTVVATTTTGGTSSTITNGSTPQYQGVAGTAYTLAEVGASSTGIDQYTATMSCSNAYAGSSTALPTSPGGSLTPQLGDVILCTITNTRRASNATLSVTKTAEVLSDPVNGSLNPFAISGAIVRYSFQVSNSGSSQVDRHSVEIIDALPAEVEVGSAANPVLVQGAENSNLSFAASSNTRYSNSVTRPSSYAACTYTPTGAYDPAVKYICFNPRGRMAGRQDGDPPPSFTLSFEGRLK